MQQCQGGRKLKTRFFFVRKINERYNLFTAAINLLINNMFVLSISLKGVGAYPVENKMFQRSNFRAFNKNGFVIINYYTTREVRERIKNRSCDFYCMEE